MKIPPLIKAPHGFEGAFVKEKNFVVGGGSVLKVCEKNKSLTITAKD